MATKRDRLEKRAGELGIKLDGRWSDETLAEKVHEVEDPSPADTAPPELVADDGGDEWPKREGPLSWRTSDGQAFAGPEAEGLARRHQLSI